MEVRSNRSFRLKVDSFEVVAPKRKSIRPIFICRSLSLKKGNKRENIVSAHTDQ